MNSLANTVFPLSTIFAGRIFVVPDYQRGYAWEDPHLVDFLDDLTSLSPDKSHYTGTLVLNKQPGEVRDAARNRFDILHVVDGQQRLTTIVILLEVLRDRFTTLGEKVIADNICSTYLIGTRDNGQPFHRLTLNEDCRDFFEQAILGGKPWSSGPTIRSQERLLAALHFFNNHCDELEKQTRGAYKRSLELLNDKLTLNLKFGAYLVESNAEVGVIFETMNDRGKKLSELEMVKNYLLYLASKITVDASQLTTHVNATWTQIFQRLMSVNLVTSADEDRFLRAHWLMAFDHVARNWSGSKSIKARYALKRYENDHTKLLGDLIAYVQSLHQAIIPFCDAHMPGHSDAFNSFPNPVRAEIRRWSVKLRRNYVLAPFLPLLMAFRLNKKASAAENLDLIQLLEKFSFRVYRWGGRRSNAGQTALLRLAHEFFRNRLNVAAVLKQVRHTALGYVANNTFFDDFTPAKDNPFYPWVGLKYCLYEYEEHLAKGGHIQLSWEQLEETDAQKSIEHILPQTPTNGFWTKRFDSDERKKFTHALGNLCLTHDNSSYGRKSFPDKLGNPTLRGACYVQGKFFMERALGKFSDWTPDLVKKRTESMRDWAVDRWHLDDSDLPGGLTVPAEDEEESLEGDGR
jgi:hypothetical protein